MAASFKYRTFTEKQLKLISWWTKDSPYSSYSGIICDGSVRSGKSLIMSLSFVVWSMQTFDGQNFGIAGKSIGSLRRNVIDQLKVLLALRGYRVHDARGDNFLIISKGEVRNTYYLFGGKDERSRDYVQGFTAAGFYFDEVVLMPRSFVEQCLARCSVEGSKYWFNCNPEGPFHWFKTEYVDKAEELKLYRLKFNLYDNPSLSKETIKRYETMFTGVFNQRFVLGEWVMANGIVYDSFNPEINTYDELPIYIKEEVKPIYTADYGTLNPMVFLEGYIDRSNSKPIVYIDREYYYSGRNNYKSKTDSEYVEDFKKFKNPNSNVLIVDPSAASFITACKTEGMFVKQAKNDVLEGISMVHTMLHTGMLKINKNCVNTLKEFGSYQWDSKRADNTGKEVPLKENDHCMDAIRYLVMTVLLKKEVYS